MLSACVGLLSAICSGKLQLPEGWCPQDPHLCGWKGRLRAYTKLRMPNRAAAVVSWRSCTGHAHNLARADYTLSMHQQGSSSPDRKVRPHTLFMSRTAQCQKRKPAHNQL
jgi:hypothetical protein